MMQQHVEFPQGEASKSITQQPTRHNEDQRLVHQDNVPMPISLPFGLEYFNGVNLLMVSQKREWLEILTDFETENRYAIFNNLGQKVFYAREQSGCCARQTCGYLRSFDMTVVDNQNREVLRFNRPLSCASCCCPCCMQTMAIMSPTGELYGSVRQVWAMMTPLFDILNANGDTVLRVKGPKVICCTPSFRVYTPDGKIELGKIKKHWTDVLQELFTDADNFAISFPIDLDVRIKAVLLGTLFLIDFMYFENTNISVFQ